MHHNAADIAGKKFGRLTAIRPTKLRKQRNIVWEYICECGKSHSVAAVHLRSGIIQSCGCLQKESITRHGMYRSKTYGIWEGVVARCNNPQNAGFRLYGGRGIKVCRRWKRFENFLADMGAVPTGLSIDRIDNDGDYKPSNCRWATKYQQARNTRRNRRLTLDGITLIETDWAKRQGMTKSALRKRLKLGWSIRKALTEPIRKCIS